MSSNFEEIKTEDTGNLKGKKKGMDALKSKNGQTSAEARYYLDTKEVDEKIQAQADALSSKIHSNVASKPIPFSRSREPSSSVTKAAIKFTEPVTLLANLTEAETNRKKAHSDIRMNLKCLMVEHKLPIADVITKFGAKVVLNKPSDSAGFSNAEWKAKYDESGPNTMKKRKKTPWYYAFLECLTNVFNLLLLFSGIVFLILYFANTLDYFQDIVIACTMIGIAFINAGVEFFENRKIASLLDSFAESIKTEAGVIRDGKLIKIPNTELVPGDIIKLTPGTKISADGVLLSDYELRLDMSNLNGETQPVERKALPNGSKIEEAFESLNVIFSSSIVVTGEGYAIVTHTGPNTLINKITTLGNTTKKKRSPLSMEIKQFCKSNSMIAVLVAFLFFIVALIRGKDFNYAVIFAIGIILAWIPQGLPLMVTFILAIAGRKMLQQNVVVKELHGIETLGAITLLATDKTGTLTKNEMTLIEAWINQDTFMVEETGSKPLKAEMPGVAQILHICATCTRARMDKDSDSKRIFIGSPTESALLQFSASKLKNIDKINELFPKIFEIPFTSDTKYHLTIHRKSHPFGGLTLHVKGAPEVVWSLCNTILVNGKNEMITDFHRLKFNEAQQKMCNKGQRVIAFAVCLLKADKYPDNYRFNFERKNYPASDFTFVGLLGLRDPPKPEVKDAIIKIRNAGIKVCMITGDHALTSASVSRDICLLNSKEPITISNQHQLPINRPQSEKTGIIVLGSVLDYLTDTDWLNIFLHQEIIFARTLAVQKLDIVTRAQSLGHIVAVTGDGFNDSPALKRADIGIAMNKSGSDISKESAGMILLDDNFASTVSGIYEGRLVFNNLQKAIAYTLTHIIAETIPYMLFVLVPFPLAISSTQILTVDLGFEFIMSLSFAFEPAESSEEIMRLPPRKPITNKYAIEKFEALQLKKQKSPSAMSLNKIPEDVTDSVQLLVIASDEPAPKFKREWKSRFGEFKRFFSDKDYWTDFLKSLQDIWKPSKDERLVDGRTLLWAYVEAGLIECLGAFVTFFTVLWGDYGISLAVARFSQVNAGIYWLPHSPDLITENGTVVSGDTQYEALLQAQSAYYLSIFLIQVFNLIACKARDHHMFGSFMLKNYNTWVLMFAGFAFAFLIVYTPVTNAIFHTSMGLHPIYLLIPMCFGLLLLIYSNVKIVIRNIYSRTKKYSPLLEIQKTSQAYELQP